MCYSGGRGIFQNQPQLCMTSSVFSTTKCKDVPHFKASRQHVRNCGQRVVLGTQTINDFVPQLNGNKVVFIFCIVSRSLNTNFGPRRWNSMFPRRVNKKCQEETCTFKGKATGKGLWVGFCAMAALCQGLLPSPEPPVPKHPKKKMRPFCQSAKLTPLLLLLSGSKSSLCVWICELFLIMYQERLKRTNCINTLTRLTMPYNTDAGTHAKHRK